MSRPVTLPSPRVVGERVLDIVRTELRPALAEALVRTTAADLKLDVTDDETVAAARALPDAAAGRPVEELHIVVARLLAERRAQATATDTYRETLAGLGERAGSAETVRPSVSVGTLGRARSRPVPLGQSPAERCDPCADVAGTLLALPDIEDPAALISQDYLTASGVLAVVYQYGDRIGFFRAVEEAVQQLDGDQLCIEDDDELLSQLYCYDEIDNRVKAPERARLAAKVLGLRDPDLAAGVRPDPVIPGLLDTLLDAINDNCDPGLLREDPTPTDAFRLESAVRTVQVRLSSSMTGLSALRVRDLQLQFTRAQDILRGLASFVRPLCRPAGTGAVQGVTGEADEWVSVSALLGPQLADGTDLFEAATTARAWRTVFDYLISSVEYVGEPSPQVCEAAAVLRPSRRWRRRSGCTEKEL